MERQLYRQLDDIQDKHWWFVARRQIVDAVLRRVAPGRRLRILEAGCGAGGNLAMLSGHGDVHAFEPDAEARQMASHRASNEVEEGLLPDRIPYVDGEFDVIVALDVIEHVEQDEASLAALRRKLARGGKIIITVPAFQFMWSQHDVSHHHYRRYDRKHLAGVLQRAGYKLDHISYCNTLLFPIAAAVRILGRLAGAGGSGEVSMPSPLVNSVLRAVFASERRWIGRISMPFGVSLLAVASNAD